MKARYFAVDDKLYLGDLYASPQLIGKMEDWPENRELHSHAVSLNIPEGEFARLTGTLFAFHVPGGSYKFFRVA